MFSSQAVLDKIKELEIEMVVVDNTDFEERIAKDLLKVDRAQIPVNLIYPPNYPAEPAVLLEESFGPNEALKALARMEEIVNGVSDESVANRAP